MRPQPSLLALALLVPATAAAEPHPFGVRDLVAMERLSDPQPSPDGRRVAFVVRTTDLEANRGRQDLWLVGADGSGLRRLTTDPASDSEPRWAPDGQSLYFLSTRAGSSQVWRLPIAGGEAERVTDLPLDVEALSVSPAGTHLAFSVAVFPDCETLRCTADRLAEREAAKATGRVYDQLFIRHWDTWKDGRRQHLFAQPVAGGEPVDVSRGLDADVPSRPFGGAEEIAWSGDGRELVFAARIAGTSEPWSTNFDLYAAAIDRSRPPRNLTAANGAWDTGPVFSPDGRTLAYRAMARPGYEADRYRVMVAAWPGGDDR
jgi:dipeptidyl aminopeptidase/acylaminoacyl peptidase